MTRAEILDTAKTCVCGQREQDYGTPEDNFRKIADLWSAYFGRDDVVFSSQDVAMMMALLKIARISTGTATEDSFVDLAGYAACGGEIEAKNSKCPINASLKDGDMFLNGVAFSSENEANQLLEDLLSLITAYGYVTVKDYLELIDCDPVSLMDDIAGWDDLSSLRIKRVYPDHYYLELPPAKIVKKEIDQNEKD